MKNIIYFLILIGCLSSCNTPYVVSNFNQITATHQIIAVLPVEMIFTGNLPSYLDETSILALEEAESQAFQIAFYRNLLRQQSRKKKSLSVNVQHHHQTNKVLEENGISIRDSWEIPPSELANILGVDAVVRTRIVKSRIMSDFASYGIEVGMDLLNLLTKNRLNPWLPDVSTQSKTIDAEYAIFCREVDYALWSYFFTEGADWRSPTDEIINQLHNRSANQFPYR